MTAQDMVAAAKQQITEVNVDKAKQLLAEGGITVVDVREESEYVAGHIDKAIYYRVACWNSKSAQLPSWPTRPSQ